MTQSTTTDFKNLGCGIFGSEYTCSKQTRTYIGYTRNMTETNKTKNTTQKTQAMSIPRPHQYPEVNPGARGGGGLVVSAS